jgi:hypothetical protein
MNKSLFLLVFIIVVFVLCLYDVLSNKNKFRVALLVDGFFNKLVMLAIIVLVLMDDLSIGIMLLLTFYVAHLRLENTEEQLLEGFEDYYSSKQI